VNEAPLRIYRHLREQPLHRPGTKGREAILHLTPLFGHMNVNRTARRERQNRSQLIGRYRSKAVWRDAHDCITKPGDSSATRFNEPPEALHVSC
jgi:hypothetical protein